MQFLSFLKKTLRSSSNLFIRKNNPLKFSLNLIFIDIIICDKKNTQACQKCKIFSDKIDNIMLLIKKYTLASVTTLI